MNAGPRGDRSHELAEGLDESLLGVIFVSAFLGLILQGPALLGEHGLTPVASYLDLGDVRPPA